ncbi:MAG: hypothetical protein WBI53_10900 [Paludibacter sp.]
MHPSLTMQSRGSNGDSGMTEFRFRQKSFYRTTEPTVAKKESNSDSLGNRSSGFLLPESESELRHPTFAAG